MKWLVFLCLVVVLEVPLEIWVKIPSQERDRIRTQTIAEYCREQAKNGYTKWRIFETIKDWRWQLHIEPMEVKL